ncbi:MAG: hypothetical protein PHU85_17895, partial [Phycisphaerae bacterium]|nr:hypothetical protein [Phycisphaerae bacterium]
MVAFTIEGSTVKHRRTERVKQHEPPSPPTPRNWGRWALAGAVSAAAVAMLAFWPTAGWLALVRSILDVAQLALLLVCAAALGSGVFRLVRLDALPRPLALLAAIALGLGLFSLAMLGAGLAGWIGGGVAHSPAPTTAPDAQHVGDLLAAAGSLGPVTSRWFFFLLPAISLALGLRPLWRIVRRAPALAPVGSARLSMAVIFLVPTIIVLIAAANLPPGVLWAGNIPHPLPDRPAAFDVEGNGYDVLEYHLQVPREYLANGRISYLS